MNHAPDGGTQVQLDRRHTQSPPAVVVSIQPTESKVQTAEIAVCLAHQLTQLQQRVVLIDLDADNRIGALCGLSEHSVAAADLAGETATRCIAAGLPLIPRLSFDAVAVIPAGLESVAVELQLFGPNQESNAVARSFSQLQRLRSDYDFIVIRDPYAKSGLAALSLASARIVLVPYQLSSILSPHMLLESARFISTSRKLFQNPAAYGVWMLPLSKSTAREAVLPAQLSEILDPNPIMMLSPTLAYDELQRTFSEEFQRGFGLRRRIATVQVLGDRLFEAVASEFLALRGV